jgi:hypothetical protein
MDRTGQVFGQLTVLYCTQKSKRGPPTQKTKWMCSCSCGNIAEYTASNLVTGNSTACLGCRAVKQITHGHASRCGMSRTYNSWLSMLGRCNNPKDHNYHLYGARGIDVCDDWLLFENFLLDMGERPANMTLDKVDNNKGYSKDNCRWATSSEQCYNRRKSAKNKSGKEGVFFRKDTGKWTAYINKDGKRIRLGCFSNKEDAIAARENYEVLLYGDIKNN